MKKLLSSILLLIFIFWVLHNFLDFSFKDIPKYFENIGGNLKKIFNSPDNKEKKPLDKVDIKEHFKKYINSLISKNKNKLDTSNNLFLSSVNDNKKILEYLKKVFSVSNNHKIRNIKFLNNFNQQNIKNGIFYPSIRVKGDYYFDKKSILNVLLELEILLTFDKKDNIFMGPINISGKSGVPKITNINILEKHDDKEIKEIKVNKETKVNKVIEQEPVKVKVKDDIQDILVEVKEKKSIQTSKLINFKIDYGDNNEKIGFTDSLIPDKIEFSDLESTSLQETSLKELNIQYL